MIGYGAIMGDYFTDLARPVKIFFGHYIIKNVLRGQFFLSLKFLRFRNKKFEFWETFLEFLLKNLVFQKNIPKLSDILKRFLELMYFLETTGFDRFKSILELISEKWKNIIDKRWRKSVDAYRNKKIMLIFSTIKLV